MDARYAVLLTPSKSSRPTQLLFYQQNASVSPLFAALTSSLYSSHSTAFSRPLFSYSYELFCNPQSHNSFVSLQFQTPLKKHRGWGPYNLCSRSGKLATHHSPLPQSAQKIHISRYPLPQTQTRPFLFNHLRTLLQFFAIFCTVFIFRSFVFNSLRALLHLGGGGGGYPLFTQRPQPCSSAIPNFAFPISSFVLPSPPSNSARSPLVTRRYLLFNQHLQTNTAFHRLSTEIVCA
jgi:hypothetical protein